MAAILDKESLNPPFITQFFDNVTEHMQKNGNYLNRLTEFKSLKTDIERVSYALKLDAVQLTVKVPDYGTTYSKSAELAVKYRNFGNQKFQCKDYNSALGFYHKSIMTAPVVLEGDSVSNELTLAYANRSAAFFHLKKYTSCLTDIKRAFQTKYPQDLQYKLYDRQARCYINLKQFISANTAFKNAKNALPMSSLDAKKIMFWEKEFAKGLSSCSQQENTDIDILSMPTVPVSPQLSSNNKVFTSLASTCDVSYSDQEGRYINCQDSILPGDIVMVEKPFASVLLPEQYNTHCHHCYSNLVAPVSCDRCPIAVFCCDECKDKATNSYHKYECEILPAMHKSGVEKFGHLSLRAVTIKTASFFKSFKQYIMENQPLDMRTKGCNIDHQYASDDYLTIFNLVGHSDLRTAEDLFKRTISAVYLLKCLQQTQFFNENKDEPFISFIGSLILSHLQTFPCNAHEVSELVLDETQVEKSDCQEIGAGIYATLSLFNHSCDPDVTRHFYGDTCVVRAVKPLASSDHLSDNYGAVYAVQNRKERQSVLTQYYFECQCNACINDWPLYPDIATNNPVLLCNECRQQLVRDTAENNTLLCKKCNSLNDLDKKNKNIQEAMAKYYKGLNSLLECNIKVAMEDLSVALTVLCNEVKLPWQYVNNAQEAIKQCFNTLGNCNVVKQRVKTI